MRFIDSTFPLVVCVGGEVYDDTELKEMREGFERYFERGERYAVINYSPPSAKLPDAKMRGKIAEWANDPHVREQSAKWCVASATVVQSALMRGAMTAILWLWKPPSPQRTVSTPEEAVDYCLFMLDQAGIRPPRSRVQLMELLRREAFGTTAPAR